MCNFYLDIKEINVDTYYFQDLQRTSDAIRILQCNLDVAKGARTWKGLAPGTLEALDEWVPALEARINELYVTLEFKGE